MLIATIALVGLFASVALAAFPDTDVKTYTGCLATQGGTMSLIKEGNSPQKPCPSGSTEAHFSGGDITKITAGTGLRIVNGDGSNYDSNGEVTIALDSAYALPQGCSNGQVVKWNGTAWACGTDNDHIYTNGTGLALDTSTGTFSIASGYRVQNNQSCDSGEFMNGIDSSGLPSCDTPGGGVTAFFQTESNPTQQNQHDDHVGIPDDGQWRRYAYVDVPPGQYVIMSSAEIGSEQTVDGGTCRPLGCGETGDVSCRLDGGRDRVNFYKEQLNDDGFQGSFSMHDLLTTTGGGTFALECRAELSYDGISLHHARIVALKIG